MTVGNTVSPIFLEKFSVTEPLAVILAEYLAGLWIDQVNPRASGTGYWHESLLIAWSWIASEPTLHVQSGVGATEHKWHGHNDNYS